MTQKKQKMPSNPSAMSCNGNLNLHHVSHIMCGTSEKMFWFEIADSQSATCGFTNPTLLPCMYWRNKCWVENPKSHVQPFVSFHPTGNGLPSIGLLELIEHGGRTRNVRLRGYERLHMAFATNPAMSRTKIWVNQNKGHIKMGHIHPTVYSKNACTYIIHEGVYKVDVYTD